MRTPTRHKVLRGEEVIQRRLQCAGSAPNIIAAVAHSNASASTYNIAQAYLKPQSPLRTLCCTLEDHMAHLIPDIVFLALTIPMMCVLLEPAPQAQEGSGRDAWQ